MKIIPIVTPLIAFALMTQPLLGKRLGEEEIVLKEFVKPVVVGSKYLDLNSRGSIDLALLIDDQGKIDDWVPIRTNDMLFIRAIEQVIDEWVFRPHTKDGEPSWVYMKVNVLFDHSGNVVTLNPGDAVLSFFNLMRDDHHIVVPFKDLDRIPKPIKMDSPPVHPDLVRNNAGDEVKFQFFIDQEGKVRLPVIRESNSEVAVEGILLETLMKWRFEPPTRNGRPVMTRAVVPFQLDG